MYEELIKELRSHNGWALNETLDEAADAIEKLQAAVEREKTYWYGIWQGGNRMSGIYIPGIRKPLSCLQCPCSGTDVDDGKEFWICEITHRVLTSTELCDNAPNDCPARPLPEHGEWIPVTERLPETGKAYLVYRHSEKLREEYTTISVLTSYGEWSLSGVTHYMVLPEPPKGEQNG